MKRPAENASRVEAVVGEDSRGEVTGLAHLADGEDGLRLVDFIQALAELRQRDVFALGTGKSILACIRGFE